MLGIRPCCIQRQNLHGSPRSQAIFPGAWLGGHEGREDEGELLGLQAVYVQGFKTEKHQAPSCRRP